LSNSTGRRADWARVRRRAILRGILGRPREGVAHVQPSRVGIRVIAGYEAAKGVLVLAAGTGLLLLVHRNAQALAERLADGRLILMPGLGHCPHIQDPDALVAAIAPFLGLNE